MRKVIKIILLVSISALFLFPTSPILADDKDAETINIAIIGDSYSAGTGAGMYYHPPKAFRSHRSWGNLYIDRLQSEGVKAKSHNFSFNGNETKEILMSIRNERHSNQNERPFEYFPHDSIDLILMTAGGNDADFGGIVEKCFAFSRTNKDECEKKIKNANDLIENGEIKKRTLEIFSEIQSKAPRVTDIIMVGYPLLSPVNSHTFGGSYNASNIIRYLGKRAEDHQKKFIEEWNEKNNLYVTYVPMTDIFSGHEPTGHLFKENPHRWINGFFETEGIFKDGATQTKFTRDIVHFYHPNITGHEKMMEAVVNKIAEEENSDRKLENIIKRNKNENSTQPTFFISSQLTKNKIPDIAKVVSKTIKINYLDAKSYTIVSPICGKNFRNSTTLDAAFIDIDITDNMGIEEYTESRITHETEESRDYICIKNASHLQVENISTAYPTNTPRRGSYYSDMILSRFHLSAPNRDSQGVLLILDKKNSFTTSGGFRSAPYIYPPARAYIDQIPIIEVGQKTTLDARSSYSRLEKIIRYDWDIDGDRKVDISTTEPTLEVSFNEPKTKMLNLYAVLESGMSLLSSTRLTVFPATDKQAAEQEFKEYIKSLKEVPIDDAVIPREELGKYIYEKYGSLENYKNSTPELELRKFESGETIIDIYKEEINGYIAREEKAKSGRNPKESPKNSEVQNTEHSIDKPQISQRSPYTESKNQMPESSSTESSSPNPEVVSPSVNQNQTTTISTDKEKEQSSVNSENPTPKREDDNILMIFASSTILSIASVLVLIFKKIRK